LEGHKGVHWANNSGVRGWGMRKEGETIPLHWEVEKSTSKKIVFGSPVTRLEKNYNQTGPGLIRRSGPQINRTDQDRNRGPVHSPSPIRKNEDRAKTGLNRS